MDISVFGGVFCRFFLSTVCVRYWVSRVVVLFSRSWGLWVCRGGFREGYLSRYFREVRGSICKGFVIGLGLD